MPLDAEALVTLQDAKDALNHTGDADDILIETAINAASLAIKDHCKRSFLERAVTAERVEGPIGPRLWLTALPIKVAAAITVSVDEAPQTVWRSEADGLPRDFDVMARENHLYRRCGWRASGSDVYNVLVSYTGGYLISAVPPPVKQAALYLVQKLYRDQKKQLAEVVAVTTASGSVTLLDNDLPKVARSLIDPYAVKRVA
jgi:hypothetical protein